MPVKVKTSISDLIAFPDDLRKEFMRKPSERKAFESAILEEYINGRSAVKGKKFKQYSKGYAKRKNKNENARTPVNMLLTGELYKSLKAIKNRANGNVTVKFKGQAVLARYHDVKGAGKGKVVRRLLPRKDGEEFKPSIIRVLNKLLKTAIKRLT